MSIAQALTTVVSLFVLATSVHAAPIQSTVQNPAPSLVEIYWKSSRTIVAPGITNLIVLDQEISRAEVIGDSIQFFGLERGETVAIGFCNGDPVSIRVRVIERPQITISPSLLQLQSEMGQGTYTVTGQAARGGGINSFALLNGFSWSQPMGMTGHLDFDSQIEDDSVADGHNFNVRRAALFYHSPGLDVHALDFAVNLTGGAPQTFLGPFSFYDVTELRGASVSLREGSNQFTVFGGTTIPFFFLTLGATRDVAGFSFDRQQTSKLDLFANTTFINAPLDFLTLNSPRQNNVMQTAGLTYRLNNQWAMGATGGMSNHGGLARGEISYTGTRMTAFAAGTVSPPLFPLNQLESLFSGTTSIRGGWTLRSEDWLTESVYYQHSTSQAIAGITRAGSSDYVSPGVGIRFAKNQAANFTYTYSRNDGGFATSLSTGNRFDTTWQYQVTPRVSNSAELTVGSLQDPLQLNSQDELTIRDAVAFPVKSGTIFLGFEHDKTNPSLAQKINQELFLLDPALQALFLQDPASFVNSSSLPPEIRALLAAENPVSTVISAAGQFNLGHRLMLNPNVSLARASNGTTESWTPFLGYGLTYQMTPNMQLNSSLSDVWVLTPTHDIAQRTTVFSLGLTRRFSAAPTSFVPGHHTRVIEGRVFRDNEVTGVYNRTDPGFAGIQVQLDNGDSVLTDDQGRFKFTGVDAAQHQVSLALTQFREPVRMTTPGERDVDIVREHFALVDFGIVNFARLMGNVFNDLRFEDKRQPDSKGLPEIRLTLDNGKEKRTVTTDGAGDYKLADILPGDYTLTVDASSVPANFVVSNDSFPVHVAPTSTVTQNVPVRALRSIAGKVFLRLAPPTPAPGPSDKHKPDATKTTPTDPPGDNSTLLPLADVEITAGFGVTTTDANGEFLLRNLPAGNLTITLVPFKDLPAGMKLPSGSVRMPAEPIQVQGASIVISNPELVPYLINKSAQEVRDAPSKPVLKAAIEPRRP